MKKIFLSLLLMAVLLSVSTSAHAVLIDWTDWTTSDSTNGFTAYGTMTTATTTVNVTYNNPLGVGFYQPSGGIDYWQNGHSGRTEATSPYTSTFVDNIPTGTDIIALNKAGVQALTFSKAIANPVFAYVSLNGNGYAFDRDFEILSVGGVDGNDCGYWGCGTSYKSIVEISTGVYEYQLLGTGEPHGALRFTGEFDTVTWRSLTNEYWNGFTVGVEGTAEEIRNENNAVPEPASMLLFGTGLVGAVLRRRRK